MEIGNILEIARCSLTEQDLIPVQRLQNKETVQQIEQIMSIPSYEEIVELANKLDEPVERFYINLKTLFAPVVYFHNGLFLEINALDDDYLRDFQVKKVIELNLQILDKHREEENYEQLFIHMDSKIRIMMFKEWFDQIPDEKLYDVFILIYTHADYGFTQIGKEYFSRIVQCRSTEQKHQMIKDLKDKMDKDGFVTIYRGVSSKSTPLDQAYSWTTQINTAVRFATRFSEIGKVYTAKVHIDDIVAYITHRDEYEVIALPEKIKDIQEIPLCTLDEIMKKYPKLGFNYGMHKKDILDKYFLNPTSIHGTKHAKRVLFFALLLAYEEKLREEDFNIVVKAAKFHDIGRTHDNYDEIHGIQSYKKMGKLGLVTEDGEDKAILRFIVENHCVPDKKGMENLKKYHIKDEKRALRLYNILKDADGLDRVRLDDTDIRYFRLPLSKKLPLVAHLIFHKE